MDRCAAGKFISKRLKLSSQLNPDVCQYGPMVMPIDAPTRDPVKYLEGLGEIGKKVMSVVTINEFINQ
jgi:hypothetical protein